MDTLHYNSEQYLFDRNIFSIGWVLKCLFRSLVYAPLFATGYFLSTLLLESGEAAVLWIASTLGLTLAVLLLIYFLKGILIALLNAGNFLWVPLALLLVGYTCLVPSWYVFHSLEKFLAVRMESDANFITWAATIAFAGYTYSRYNFLTDTAPTLSVLAYRAGHVLGTCFA